MIAAPDRERLYVLPIQHEKPRRIVAHVYKHGPEPANVWFSVKGHKENPEDLDDHETDLSVGFEAEVTADTAENIDTIAKQGLEQQEDTITKAFFETLLRCNRSRERLMHTYPEWATQLVRYLHDGHQEIRTEYYFKLDARMRD